MMLRSRNNNSSNIITNDKPGDLAKRGKKTTLTEGENTKGEPQPKRAALGDLSKAISNVIIDSSKKATVVDKKPLAAVRVSKRSNSASEHLMTTISENIADADLSIVEIPVEDPCPSYDFDSESAEDPHAVALYASDIFKYYRSREKNFAVGDYMPLQKKINAKNRASVVDWMVEVQEQFLLNHETLYLAVKLLDLYLCTQDNVEKSKMQLIASVATFIASKFDERSPPLIDDFIYLAEDAFNRADMIKMEIKLLDTIGCDLGCPLSYRYVRRFARVTKQDMGTLTLARYILEMTLMFYEFVGVSESFIAAGAFLLALKMKDACATWTPVLQKYSGLRAEDVEAMMWEVNHMMHMRTELPDYRLLETVFSKYSHEVFFNAACVPLVPNKFPKNRPLQAPAGKGFSY